MVKRVTWGPFDQKMLMGREWIGSSLLLFAMIEKELDFLLETMPVEAFMDFFYCLDADVTSVVDGCFFVRA